VKAMFAGFALLIIVSAGAWYGLERSGFSSADKFSSGSVRLD